MIRRLILLVTVTAAAGCSTVGSPGNAPASPGESTIDHALFGEAWEVPASTFGRLFSIETARVDRYIPTSSSARQDLAEVVATLRSKDLPPVLAALPLVESSLVPTAVSSVGAAGWWQIMPATALDLGLVVESDYDERFDVELATLAATRYLAWLAGEVRSWVGALVAYNWGVGRYNRLREQLGTDNPYVLLASGRVPQEVVQYVARVSAIGVALDHRAWLGTAPAAGRFTLLEVDAGLRLDAVADALDMDRVTLLRLNAAYVLGHTPTRGRSWGVRVPSTMYEPEIRKALASMSPWQAYVATQRTDTTVYVVKGGDSWWRIAQAHQMSIDTLRAINPGAPEMLHPGQRLKVLVAQDMYGGRGVAELESSAAVSAGPVSVSVQCNGGRGGDCLRDDPYDVDVAEDQQAEITPLTYVVGEGESLFGVAQKIGVGVADLMAWNSMVTVRELRAGESLYYVPGHTVVRTRVDLSIEDIAARTGIAVRELLLLNRLSSDALPVGTPITVPGSWPGR